MDKKRLKEAIDEPEKLIGEEIKYTLKKGKKTFTFDTIKAVRKEGNEVRLEFDPDKPGLSKLIKRDGNGKTDV